MEGQFRNLLRQKIIDSLAATVTPFTRRGARLPGVKGTAVAIIGMRRTGKTTFLWQIVSDRLAKGTGREGLLYFSFTENFPVNKRFKKTGLESHNNL